MVLNSYLLPLILSGCLVTTSMPVEKKCVVENIKAYQSVKQIEEYKLLASLPKQNIYLYAMDWKEEEIKQRGVYKNILLDLNGKQIIYPCWNIDTNPSFSPELILSDINNDGKSELIIISTSATGTGVMIQEARVFDIETSKDINVMSPIEGIYQHVKTNISKNNGIVTISINVDGNIFTMRAKESSVGSWDDDVGWGSQIRYNVINNKLVAKVGLYAAFDVICGDIIINYSFKNKRLELSSITFKKINDSNIFY